MTCPRRHLWSMSELEFESRPSALQVTPFPSHHLVSLRGGWQPSTETPGWKQRVETALMKGESEPGRAPRAGSSSARAPGGARFPAFSAANYWLHFFLSLLRCFRCPHQGLQTQPAGEGCASGLAREQMLRKTGLQAHSRPPPEGKGFPCG